MSLSTEPVRVDISSMDEALTKSYEWLDHIQQAIQKTELDKDDFVSWGAYHASLQEPLTHQATIIILLPLFLECTHSVAMIQHSMNVVNVSCSVT